MQPLVAMALLEDRGRFEVNCRYVFKRMDLLISGDGGVHSSRRNTVYGIKLETFSEYSVQGAYYN